MDSVNVSSDNLSQPPKPSEQHAGARESSAEALNRNAASTVNGESTAQDTPPTSVTAAFTATFDSVIPPTVKRRGIADACFSVDVERPDVMQHAQNADIVSELIVYANIRHPKTNSNRWGWLRSWTVCKMT
jgi:hypothetical protein